MISVVVVLEVVVVVGGGGARGGGRRRLCWRWSQVVESSSDSTVSMFASAVGGLPGNTNARSEALQQFARISKS